MNAKLFASLLIAQTVVFAESEVEKLPEVAVTANRTETELSKINRSITVITSEEIEQKKAHNLIDLLAQTPGIDVKRTGAGSNQVSVFIRGMRSYHTKVMVDGVALTDLTTPNSSPIFPKIPLENVERIEIIRGGASTLYGSNAIGGVINIITKTAGEDSFGGEVDMMVNKHGDQEYSTVMNGRKGKVDYNVVAGWLDENSISSSKLNNEDDAQRALTLNGNVGYQATDNLKLTFFGTYEDQDAEYDGFGSAPGDWHLQNSQIGAKVDATDLFDKFLDTSIRYAFTESVRNDRDNAYAYTGQVQELDWQNTLKLNDYNRLILGLTYTDEHARSDVSGTKTDDSYWTQAYFAQYEFEPIENLLLDAGVRYNNHSVFGGETTYSASASYYIEATGTKLRTSWNTGYRAPSLYELYKPYRFDPAFPPYSLTNYESFGNPDLVPETSESWEIGFDQELCDKLTFGMTYFTNRITNYIGWVETYNAGTNTTTGTYQQVDGIKVYGVESFIEYKATKDVTINLTHTYQHSNDMQNNQSDIVYLPDNKASAAVNWSATDKLNLNVNGLYVSERNDVSGVELNSYTLLNIAASYEVTEAFEVYGKIDNLLDKDYEEVAGYETHGIMPYIGLKYRF